MTALSGIYAIAAFICLIRIFACAVVAVEAQDKGNAIAAAVIKKKAEFWIAGLWIMIIFSIFGGISGA